MSRMERMIGDIEARYCGDGAGGRAALVRSGSEDWYALTVSPQREDEAEAWLSLRGVYAFHPVTTRRVRRMGRERVYHRRYLPGYVFARFPGRPVVHAVMACPFITGAITMADGRWGKLKPEGLRAIHAMRKLDADAEAARRADAARRRRARMLRRGDSAMFRSGPFAEFHCEVVDLRADGGARVRFQLFGREVLAEAGCADLVPLRKHG